MVATRQHPRGDFPEYEPSPTKKPSRTSTASPAPTSSVSDLLSTPAAKSLARRTANNARIAANDTIAATSPPNPSDVGESTWCHTASNLTVLWITISLPLVLWDTLYILLRPHTFAGGALQWPIWKPYEIYASIDKVYSREAWDANQGFGGAQGVLNAVELVLYGLYIMILWNHGKKAAAGTGVQVGQGLGAWFAGGVKIRGEVGNRALVLGFTASVMTVSKTVLYCKCCWAFEYWSGIDVLILGVVLNEYFSDFNSVKHNDWLTLAVLYYTMK